MSLANLSDGASVNSAAEKLRGVLSEPSEPTDSQPVDQSTQEAEQSAPESEATQPETLEQSDTEAPSRRRKAKLGDREIEFEILSDDVDPDLIPKGLMMENDYRQKTMSLSEEKKALESKKSELDNYLSELSDMLMMEAEQLDSDEMKELKELDPDQYWKKFEETKSKAEKFKTLKEKRNAEILEQQKQLVQKEAERYTQLIPEWLDESTKQKDTEKMVSFLANNGFTQDEISTVYDARTMAVIRKAALFDEISKQDIAAKRVQTPPKSAKPSAAIGKAEKTARQKAMDRLKKTGKVNDAQAAIKNLILGGN